MQYYFSLDGTNQQGPLDASALRAAGVGPQTMVWREGQGDWLPAGQVPELAGLFPSAGAVPPPSNFAPPPAGPRPGQMPHQDLSYQGAPVVGTNGMAIASFVCGIVGLTGFCCCATVIASILAIIFGHIARGQIRQGHGTGDGFALTGLILGYFGVLLAILGVSLFSGGRFKPQGFKTPF